MQRIVSGDVSASFAPDSAVQSFIVRGHQLIGSWPGSKGPASSMTMWPVVGMVSASGSFSYKDKIYTPGKHGYLRGKPLAAEMRGADTIVFTHEHFPETTDGVCPFSNHIEIEHALAGDALISTVAAANRSPDAMRFGAGLHPAFVWPMDEHGNHGDSRVTLAEALPEGTAIYRTVDGLVQADNRSDDAFEGGCVMCLKPSDFEKDAFFVVLPEAQRGKRLTLIFSCPHNDYDLEVTLVGWDGFGIWSKPGAASTFLCIEPLAGVALVDRAQGDVPKLEEIKGLRTLDPAAMFKASMKVRPIFRVYDSVF